MQKMGSQAAIPPLFVNDGQLASDNVTALQPSSAEEPPHILLNRLQQDGYLWIKGLLPRADILRTRQRYFEFLSRSGVLKPGSSPVDGVFDDAKDIAGFPGIGAGSTGQNARPGGDKAQLFVDLAIQAHSEPWYTDDFCQHPALAQFVERLTGWGQNTMLFRRSLLRNNIPGSQAIGVHYDQIFLRWGGLSNLTSWCPLGDISIDGGGLIYLENSLELGERLENEFAERARNSGFSETEVNNAFNKNMLSNGLLSNDPAAFALDHGKRWMAAEYEAGDVVIHLPYMVRRFSATRLFWYLWLI